MTCKTMLIEYAKNKDSGRLACTAVYAFQHLCFFAAWIRKSPVQFKPLARFSSDAAQIVAEVAFQIVFL